MQRITQDFRQQSRSCIECHGNHLSKRSVRKASHGYWTLPVKLVTSQNISLLSLSGLRTPSQPRDPPDVRSVVSATAYSKISTELFQLRGLIKFHKCSIKVKESHYRPGHSLRVPGSWGFQISRQSAYNGGKVVRNEYQEIFLVLISVRSRVKLWDTVRP